VSARRPSIVLVSIAAALVAAAAVLRFLVAPNATELSGDTDQTVHYAGKATMLDSEALRSGDTAHALRSGIPVTVDRRVRVTSTHGDTAVLTDAMTVRAGEQSLPSVKTYAVDRRSREGTSAPASKTVEPSRGALSSAFPPDADRGDSYRYYDPTTRSIVPVRYTGSARREGRTVNVYDIKVSAPVKDPAVLKPLPTALPKKLVTALAGNRVAPAALSALPDPVPLAYQARSTLVAYIDRQTGVAVDQSVSRDILATTTAAGERISLLPVSSLTFQVTPESRKTLGDKAASAGLFLTALTDAIPLTLVVVAALLVLIAFRRGRTRKPDASAPRDPSAATLP
jgi:hypothetical protein